MKEDKNVHIILVTQEGQMDGSLLKIIITSDLHRFLPKVVKKTGGVGHMEIGVCLLRSMLIC